MACSVEVDALEHVVLVAEISSVLPAAACTCLDQWVDRLPLRQVCSFLANFAGGAVDAAAVLALPHAVVDSSASQRSAGVVLASGLGVELAAVVDVIVSVFAASIEPVVRCSDYQA